MHDVAATAADIAARGPRLLDAPDRPARQGKARQGKAAGPLQAAAALRYMLCSGDHAMARYTTQNIPAGACVGTCATVRDSAVRTEWLHSVRVLRTSA